MALGPRPWPTASEWDPMAFEVIGAITSAAVAAWWPSWGGPARRKPSPAAPREADRSSFTGDVVDWLPYRGGALIAGVGGGLPDAPAEA